MSFRIRQLRREEGGFTLIELLVVVIIVGLLAAIAIPAFFNQKEKAVDSKAKSYAHSAMVTMEACRVDAANGYTDCDVAALRGIEPTLPANPTLKVSGLGELRYTIVVQSTPKTHTFTVERANNGELEFTCNAGGEGGCPSDEKWD